MSMCVAVLWSSISLADGPVSGRVVDEMGAPIANALVSPFWRANGSPTKPDGSDYDLLDPAQNEVFWGNVGEMAPFQPPVLTDQDGRFTITLPGRFQHLYAITSARTHGAIAFVNTESESVPELQLTARRLIEVRGQMKSPLENKQVDWAHLYVEAAYDASRPLTMRRLISCGTYDDGKFVFSVPPGTYSLDVYANSERTLESNDLGASAPTTLKVDGKQASIDIGTISLMEARADRTELEASAKDSGRWRDYTKHYGEPAPPWHSIATKGMNDNANVKDFRGKWLLINFWGMSCVPCLAHGVPRMMEFYDQHSAHRDRFEIVGVCIDMDERFSNFAELDKALQPIVRNVWGGKQIEYPQALDNSFQSWERYGIPGLGTVVLIDPEGNLHEGDDTTLARILAENEALPSRAK